MLYQIAFIFVIPMVICTDTVGFIFISNQNFFDYVCHISWFGPLISAKRKQKMIFSWPAWWFFIERAWDALKIRSCWCNHKVKIGYDSIYTCFFFSFLSYWMLNFIKYNVKIIFRGSKSLVDEYLSLKTCEIIWSMRFLCTYFLIDC